MISCGHAMRCLRRMTALLAMLAVMAVSAPVQAVEPDEILPDPKLESRARALSLDLRCLVCQNQSIDDSNAPLARDLRLLVRERLKAGDSDADVMSYVVARYGDFVLLRPPFKWNTLILWLSAPVLLLAVGTMLWRSTVGAPRGGTINAAGPPLSRDEEARLANLLEVRASDPATPPDEGRPRQPG